MIKLFISLSFQTNKYQRDAVLVQQQLFLRGRPGQRGYHNLWHRRELEPGPEVRPGRHETLSLVFIIKTCFKNYKYCYTAVPQVVVLSRKFCLDAKSFFYRFFM